MIRAGNKTAHSVSTKALAQGLLMAVPAIGHALRMAASDGASADPERMNHHMLMHAVQDGARSFKDLIARRNVSAPTLSRSVNVLVHRGWMERIENPDDRRQVLLRLTPAGFAEFMAARIRMTQNIAQILAGLTAAERDTAMQSFQALNRVFGAYHGRKPNPPEPSSNLKKTT